MGYYLAEKELFEEITSATGAVDCRHPLAYILEAADDIAYKTADIEDAVKKGFITYSQLIRDLKSEKYSGKCADEQELNEYQKAIDRLEYYYKTALENETSSPEQNAVQRWIIYVQGVLLKCAAFGFTKNYHEIMNGSFKDEILSVSHANALASALGDLALRYVFKSKPIYKLEISAGTILNFLLDKLVNAVLYYDTDKKLSPMSQRLIALISENYIKAYRSYSEDKNDNEKLYLRLLLVTDFICGMTDSYAKRLYQELSGIM